MTCHASISLRAVAQNAIDDVAFDAYRATIGVIDELMGEEPGVVEAAIRETPPATGDARIDALMAAAAEHVAFHRGLGVPAWVVDASRSLRTAWFPVDLPSLRVQGLVSSPASFARRGIYIDRRDLERV